jgi:predicted glycosyltransferase
MKYLFHLGHPAHFHLFKNVIEKLHIANNEVFILIKKKDVLEDLLKSKGFKYFNILPHGRKDNKVSIALGQLKQDWKLFWFCLRNRPNLLIGTSVAISHVGKMLGIPSININEDDADVVPLYAKLAYPWATEILCPKVCSAGIWDNKAMKYESYHELAYLHPNHFEPNERVLEKYNLERKKFFLLRFAKLGAHHDEGIKGISNELAYRLIQKLEHFGQIIISSERPISNNLEKYRMQIIPADMHDILYFTRIFIGDSQTMSAEAGVLGTPFIRFNDFVGKIGYLNELENDYHLGFGVKTKEVDQLFKCLDDILKIPNLEQEFQSRREFMLSKKIDFTAFLFWFISTYPESAEMLRNDVDFQNKL